MSGPVEKFGDAKDYFAFNDIKHFNHPLNQLEDVVLAPAKNIQSLELTVQQDLARIVYKGQKQELNCRVLNVLTSK